MKKVPEDKKNDAAKRVEQLEVEVSILRDAYFQLEKALVARKRAEVALRDSENKFRNIFMGVNDGIIYVSKLGNIIDINKRVEEIFGYKREELVGKHFIKIGVFGLKDVPVVLRLFKESTVRGKTTLDLMELAVKRKNGELITIEASTQVLKKGDKVQGAVAIIRDITERKQAEEKIKIYAKAFDESPNSALLVDYKNGQPHILHVNESFTKYYGYKEREVLGKNPRLLKSGNQDKKYYKKMWSTILDPKVGFWRDEIINKKKDGSLIDVLLNITTIFDKKGKPDYFVANHIDITDRKKAELQLRERMKELRIIYETSKIMEGNDDLGEALSKLVEVVPPAYQFPEIACARIIYDDMEYKTANFKETKWRQSAVIQLLGRESGMVEVFYLESKPFLVEEEEMIKEVASQISNISERKKAEGELKKAAIYIDAMGEALMVLDMQRRIVKLNKAGLKLWGYTEKESLNLTFEDVIPKREHERQYALMREVVKKGFVDPFETLIVTKNGKEILVLLSGTVLKDDSGKPIGFTGVFRDITELKKAEEKLRGLTDELRKEKKGVEQKVVERTEELRETQKRELAIKDEFVFIATHDLSTPVTAVIGYLDFIKVSKEKFSEDTQKSFKAIEEAARRLEQLVEDLLQVARSESGTIKVEVSPVNIIELIAASIRQTSLLAKERNIKIKSELDQNGKSVLADDEKLSEVIENLLSNAIKFNRDGGRVDVKSVRVGDKLQVSIADTGYGILKAQQGKVFQKFFRARGKETKDVPGTGLGLFVVRMLIEKMKGQITFTSEEGKGTTFTFTLPISKEVPSSPQK